MSWTYTASGKPTIVCEYEFPVDNFRVFPALNARYTDLAEFSQHCLYQRIAFCTMRLGAVQSGAIAKQFGIQEDAVLLNIEEKIYDIHDHAVGFASCYIHPENMQLTMAVQFSN